MFGDIKMVMTASRRVFTAGFLVSFVAVSAAFAQSASAPAGKSKPGERTARVAGGQTVTLAISMLSAEELSARRPEMKQLIPKIR
jgi:hypothetical protein